MVKEIRLFIGRDPRSLELFRSINEVLRELPPGERPRLRVKTFKIKDPGQFSSFIKQLEELFGGMYTVEVRKYGIKAIPAIVVDGEKVLEGEYPSVEKLREILLGPSLVAEAGLGEQITAPTPSEISPIPPVSPPRVEKPEMEAQPQLVEQPSSVEMPQEAVQPLRYVEANIEEEAAQKPVLNTESTPSEPELRTVAPVEEPEEFKLEEEEAPISTPTVATSVKPPEPVTQPPQASAPEEAVKRETPLRPEQMAPYRPQFRPEPRPAPPRPPIRQPPRIPRPPAPGPRELAPKPPQPPRAATPGISREIKAPAPSEKPPENIDLSKTCLSCIFYSKERKRCTLYHIPIEDPYHPPPICDRVKR